jgi:hypothetical protein
MSGNRRSPRFLTPRGRGGGPAPHGPLLDDDNPDNPQQPDGGDITPPAGGDTPPGDVTPPTGRDQMTPVAGVSSAPGSSTDNNTGISAHSTLPGNLSDDDVFHFDPATASPEQMRNMFEHIRTSYMTQLEREAARREQVRLSKQPSATPRSPLATPSSPSSTSPVPSLASTQAQLRDGAIAHTPAAISITPSALTAEIYGVVRDVLSALLSPPEEQAAHPTASSTSRQVRFVEPDL